MSQQPEKFEATSANITDEQKAKLKSLFPEIVTEGGKIDFDRLKLTLGDAVDAGKERYGMNWPGKADCFKTIQRPSMATLVPARDESVNFDTTENLIIEGDNLETLKLLQKAYLGKVKVIYIDPPYNTGNDFIYPDDFSETLETYLRYTGQVDNEGRKFSTNTEADGRFHSKWMNMMYPRLFLARNLIKEDGFIFVSIDDHEVQALRSMLNEIFGEENFVAQITWQRAYSPVNLKRHFSENHDFILCFAKNIEKSEIIGLKRSDEANARYSNPDNDPRGAWKSSDLSVGPAIESNIYEITTPSGRKALPPRGYSWRLNPTRFEEFKKDNRIWFGPKGEAVPSIKRFLSEVKDRVTPMTLWLRDEVGDSQEATRDLKELFDDEAVLEYPKPSRLLKRIMELTTENNDWVMDFFAGSGTTAQAVLESNVDDKGSRKFILVQLPEPTSLQNFPTVADITKERVRRVIKKLNNKDGGKLDLESGAKPDRGFKVFKLQSSNFKAWNTEQPKDDTELVKQLTLHVDHLVAGRTQDDVLYELLLKSGFPLDTEVEKITMAGKNVFSVADGAMLICLEKELTPEVIKAMAEKKPERVVCLDAGFADNDQLKTNAVQTMKSKGVTKFQTV